MTDDDDDDYDDDDDDDNDDNNDDDDDDDDLQQVMWEKVISKSDTIRPKSSFLFSLLDNDMAILCQHVHRIDLRIFLYLFCVANLPVNRDM